MSNSSLVSYTRISPNKSSPRNHKIDTISIHCVVGQCSVETLGEVFAPSSRQASSNYGVGVDGRIGMYVEEKDRSWCTSSSANDNRAITIEVASNTYEPYWVNDKAYAALIDLLVDICKRNGIAKLVWSTNKNDRVNHLNGCNMTVHRDYAAKSCPGDYLYNLHGDIAAKVNARLGTASTTPSTPSTPTTTSELYRVRKAWSDVSSQVGAYKQLDNAKACADKNPGYTVFNSKGEAVYPAPKVVTGKVPYLVRVKITDLNIRTGAGIDFPTTGKYTGANIFTIVEEKQGKIASDGTMGTWGKLKSGAGWICLAYDEYTVKV